MAGCRISLCDEHRSELMKACVSELSAVVVLCLVVVHLDATQTSLDGVTSLLAPGLPFSSLRFSLS